MTRTTRPTVVMRFDAPAELNRRLHIAASQLGVTIRDLLLDGAALVLRFNNLGHGCPQPPVRVTPVQAEAEEQEVEIKQVVEIEQPDEQGAGA